MKNSALLLAIAACVYVVGLIVGASIVPQQRVPLLISIPFTFWTLAFCFLVLRVAFVWETARYEQVRKETIEKQLKLDETVRILQAEVVNLRNLRNLPYGSE